MMGRSKWLVLLLLAAVLFSGCAKKQTTPMTEGAQAPEAIAPATEQAPPPEKAPVVEEKPAQAVITLQDIYFAYDKYNIKPEYKDVLTKNAELLMANPNVKLLIEGHCDERGTAEYNIALGERRARAALDFYTAYGVRPERLNWISYGKERPFDPGHNEEAWAKNRRAHMVIQ
jgi:peptidoglycan-associated lipoprotein